MGILAQRYFSSHGPATLQDFTWWSGLSITDAKMALGSVQHKFISETISSKKYWVSDMSKAPQIDGVLLLPALDEYVISYKDRSAA